MERRLKRKLKVLEAEKLQTNIYICKPEKGSLLGDNDDEMNVGLIPIDDTTDYSEDQHEGLKRDSSGKSHVFKSNHWCLHARYVVEQQIDIDVKQVVDKLENDGTDVNMRDIVAELKFLKEWLGDPKLEHNAKEIKMEYNMSSNRQIWHNRSLDIENKVQQTNNNVQPENKLNIEISK